MVKSIDEIKKGLEHCINGTSCRGCPYCEECAIASDCNPMHKDLQEYVQQLEEFADKKIVELFEKVEQLQAERDALISDFEQYDELPCALCEHYSKGNDEIPCKFCKNLATPTDEDKVSQWEWRGVQKEE